MELVGREIALQFVRLGMMLLLDLAMNVPKVPILDLKPQILKIGVWPLFVVAMKTYQIFLAVGLVMNLRRLISEFISEHHSVLYVFPMNEYAFYRKRKQTSTFAHVLA